MQFYFLLQFRMLNRQITEFGVHPLIGYFVFVAAFVGLSFYLFTRIGFAEYIYLSLALSLILKLSGTDRNNFLRTCFSNKRYYRIRLAENALAMMPFLIFLSYRQSWLSALALLAGSFISAFVNFRSRYVFAFPTPFGQKPFEFTVGFRNSWGLLLSAFILSAISVSVGNFNLGVFSQMLIFLVVISYYLNPEHAYFVWIHAHGPGRFLATKIRTALIFSNLLSLPVIIVLSVGFPDKIPVLLGFQVMSCIYLSTVILAKYAVFPSQINLPEFVILAVSVSFPPILIGVIPFFYSRAVKRLDEILK